MACPFVFIMLMLVVLPAVLIPLAINQSKQTNAAWGSTARRMGLRFSEGSLTRWRRITGDYHGFQVEVHPVSRGSGKNRRTYTRVRVTYPTPLGLGLQLSSDGFFAGITKLFGAQDIEVGDPGFDSQVLVKGNSPARVRDFLTPARRLRIHRFLSNHPNSTIYDTHIDFEQRGLIRDQHYLTSIIEKTVQLAWHLTGNRPQDATVSQAMAAQDEGRPDEALRILAELVEEEPATLDKSDMLAEPAESVEPTDFQPRYVDEQMMVGEMLYLGDRREEAQRVFEKVQAVAPDDEEAQQWMERTRTPQPPAPPAASAATAPEVKTVCEAVFAADHSSFTATQVFEEQFAGQQVTWTGKLRRIEPLNYDLVFHDRTGCKATFEIFEIPSVYGSKTVSAVVQFPSEAQSALKDLTGRDVRFKAQLLKADGFMHNLFLAGGVLV